MHTFTIGAIVRHFKREYITNPQSAEYLYKILAFASHTETGEKLVIPSLYRRYRACIVAFVPRKWARTDLFLGRTALHCLRKGGAGTRTVGTSGSGMSAT